jgi:tRNA-modifying protein YgfZ
MTLPLLTFLPLPRGILTLTGPDSKTFLQGLISQDIDLLITQPMIYGCLLSPQGKFLHDFFIQKMDGGYVIDCETDNRRDDLIKRLSLYRLRAKVVIEPRNGLVVVGFDPPPNSVAATPDPRHPDMGWRYISLEPEVTLAKLKTEGYKTMEFNDWDAHRIALTVPDGSRDAEVGISTLEEMKITRLNGVSFTKGCYVGQELTARMHNRNPGKRHLQTVNVNALPDGAELRSSCREIGLALVRT